MAYRKLGRDNKHRRSMLATLTKQLIINERIVTTETRAKEVRKYFDKMVTYGKNGSLVSRRLALAFLHNDEACVAKVFGELATRYKERNGGYTRIVKYKERKVMLLKIVNLGLRIILTLVGTISLISIQKTRS